VRVIDMSRLVSGNMVSLQLADFGAEVIKIEDPKRGDPLRAWQTDGVSVHWKVYSRNKKSLAMSLREARGRELFLDLIATSQVLIENFRPGTLEAMGFGPDVLHRQNPRLIILRVSGWGQDGPYRDRPGFGTLVESMSGYASRTGFPDREPALPPTALADMVAGLYGAFAVMVALRQVEAKGGATEGVMGQVIDLPLLDPLFSFIATEAAIYRLTGTVRERTGKPLRDDLAAQRVPHQGRPLYRHLGLDPGNVRTALPGDRPGRHDHRPALSHQQRPGQERRSLRIADRRVHRSAHSGREHGNLRARRSNRRAGLRHRPVHGRPARDRP
jgi:crotonobetainyl-CoA:carnitine CoA-transferase CaiB-like acyl-CoA transferase